MHRTHYPFANAASMLRQGQLLTEPSIIAVFGHNPTPDQSDVEANAHAMGINFEDDEPLTINRKLDERDKNRFELKQRSKGEGNMI